MEKQIQKISSKGSPRFGEAGGPATGWKTKISKGSILAVSLIILGLMLVSALSFSLVTIQERKASIGENKSNQAYSTAETGVEKVMQLMKNNEGGTLSNIDASCANGVITSTEGYTVKFKDATDNFITDCGTPIALVKSVKSIGTVGQNQRAVEVAVASDVDNGCITCDIPSSSKKACTMVKNGENICTDEDGCSVHIMDLDDGHGVNQIVGRGSGYLLQNSEGYWGLGEPTLAGKNGDTVTTVVVGGVADDSPAGDSTDHSPDNFFVSSFVKQRLIICDED